MPISQEGENAKIPKRDFVPGGHYAKITKRERVQEGVIAKVFEGVIVLVGDYSRGCTCQALQEGKNARGAKMLGGEYVLANFLTSGPSQARAPQFFADHLTLLNQGGHIVPISTTCPSPPDFQTLQRPRT